MKKKTIRKLKEYMTIHLKNIEKINKIYFKHFLLYIGKL